METQIELNKTIGNIENEKQTLQPKKVKIVGVEIIPVGLKKNLKVNCIVKHPDRENTITISSICYIKDKQVSNSGLWYNLDKEENIQKGSALAIFLNHTESKNLKELEGKDVETELDGIYLSFKSY